MRRPGSSRALGALASLAAVAALVLLVRHANRLPDGPEPVAWDRAPCAFCRMHVGEPRFAAQLQGRDGEVRNYDDPGCLLADLAESRPPVHALWFHDSRPGAPVDGAWIAGAEVAFAVLPASDPTPMSYGLGAVPRGTPGSIDIDAALERVAHHKALAQGGDVGPGAGVGDAR